MPGFFLMGALIIAIGGSRLGELLPRIPRGQRDELAQALGSGGGNGAAGAVGRAINEAFVSAVSTGLRLSAAFAVAGALLGWLLIAPRRPRPSRRPPPRPQASSRRARRSRPEPYPLPLPVRATASCFFVVFPLTR